MRLHRMRLSAFGPFPGTEEVDFDALSEAGLFLLRGETGAGKTSVLDAMCFALYGTLPGVRAGNEKGVRSHYAEATAAPEVELEFSVRERTFKVVRSPEWQRPKLRGTGFTKAQASVSLAELRGGTWEMLSTRLDEAGQMLGSVLGMDVHQFTRVAMLPQGEFAAFLRSDDKDREKLLKRLFDTTLFDRTTAAAAEHHRKLDKEAGEFRVRRAAQAEQVGRYAREQLGEEGLLRALGAPSADVATEDGDGADTMQASGAPDAEDGVGADTAQASGAPGAEGGTDAMAVGGRAAFSNGQDPSAQAEPWEAPSVASPEWFGLVTEAAAQREHAAHEEVQAANAMAVEVADALEQARSVVQDEAELRNVQGRRAELDAGAEHAAQQRERLSLHQRALSVRSPLDAEAQAAGRAQRLAHDLAAAAVVAVDVPSETIVSEGHIASGWLAWIDSLRALAAPSTEPDVGSPAFRGAAGEDAPGAGDGHASALLAQAAPAGQEAQAGQAAQSGQVGQAAQAAQVAQATQAAQAAQAGQAGQAAQAAQAAQTALERAAEWQSATKRALEDSAQAIQVQERAKSAAQALAGAQRETARASSVHEAAARAQTGAQQALLQAQESLAATPAPEREISEAVLALDAARARAVAAAAAVNAATALAEADAKEVAAHIERVAAKDGAYELRRAREQALAASLAAELKPGEECLVCGSLEHPHPRTDAEGQHVSRQEIAAADARVEKAEAMHVAAAAVAVRARSEWQAALASAGELSPESAQAAQSAAAQALETTQRAHEALAKAERAVQEAQAALARADEAASSAAEALETRVSAEAVAQRDHAKAQEAAVAARGVHADVAARRSAAMVWAEAFRAVHTAAQEAVAAASEAQQAEHTATLELSRVGLTRDAATAALLAPAQAQELQTMVQSRAQQEARVTEAEAAPAVARARAARATGTPVPSPEAVQELVDAVTRSREANASATAAHALAQEFSREVGERAAQIGQLDAQMGPLLRRAKVAADIAALTSGNGENRLNMTLSTYVLAARLEAVAEAATLRLDAMSEGRYRLVHVDEKRGNRRSGLGIAVEDAWTNSQRAPETLSGGETFMASLALALGLADVVQEESGGVDVETLFVDEGFGTLDPETLELVLDGLDQLRQGGRLVGVVSHVAELGQRIPAQIRVEKSRQGSSLRLDGVGTEA